MRDVRTRHRHQVCVRRTTPCSDSQPHCVARSVLGGIRAQCLLAQMRFIIEMMRRLRLCVFAPLRLCVFAHLRLLRPWLILGAREIACHRCIASLCLLRLCVTLRHGGYGVGGGFWCCRDPLSHRPSSCCQLHDLRSPLTGLILFDGGRPRHPLQLS
jgi:hypothetical protein